MCWALGHSTTGTIKALHILAFYCLSPGQLLWVGFPLNWINSTGMNLSPQTVIPPGMEIWGKTMWRSGYWRAKAAAYIYAGGSNSWQRGKRLSSTSTFQLCTWCEALPIWRQGYLSLIHTVSCLPAVAFQEGLATCPCIQHLFPPACICIA